MQIALPIGTLLLMALVSWAWRIETRTRVLEDQRRLLDRLDAKLDRVCDTVGAIQVDVTVLRMRVDAAIEEATNAGARRKEDGKRQVSNSRDIDGTHCGEIEDPGKC